MSKLFRILVMSLALTICAGVFFFPMTAFAAEVTAAPAETDVYQAVYTPSASENTPQPTGTESPTPTPTPTPTSTPVTTAVQEETVSGIPAYDGPSYITPDGAATVIDNTYIEGNGMEFFTFKTKAGNVFYLVVDRLRTQDNVYFLNAVTEQDLMALAEKDGGSVTSTSGVPPTPSETITEKPTDIPAAPEQPAASKSGMNSGTIIFILIGVAAVGGAAYYFKILRPKQQKAADDNDGADFEDDDDYGDTDDYGDGDSDTPAADTDKKE